MLMYRHKLWKNTDHIRWWTILQCIEIIFPTPSGEKYCWRKVVLLFPSLIRNWYTTGIYKQPAFKIYPLSLVRVLLWYVFLHFISLVYFHNQSIKSVCCSLKKATTGVLENTGWFPQVKICFVQEYPMRGVSCGCPFWAIVTSSRVNFFNICFQHPCSKTYPFWSCSCL